MSINKIFEIGVMKTGTSSLGEALKILGYKTMKWHSIAYDKFIESGRADYQSLFDIIDQYDAFEDGPWHDCDFRKLDKHYPNSKFIMLERDDESWIRSMELHSSPAHNVNKISKKYLQDEWVHDRLNTINKNLKWKKEKYRKVREFFKNRPQDLLVMNICSGEGWEKLCPFLNRKVLNRPFPKNNVSAVIMLHSRRARRARKVISSRFPC